MVYFVFIISVPFFLEYVSCDTVTNAVELQTRLGVIQGYETIILNKRVRCFLNIPFAEAPIGENRFRPPKLKLPWKDILDATQLAPACIQGKDTAFGDFWGADMWNSNTPTSEDCLRLNIWAPANAYNLSTMVWLFGGGYYSGSPSLLLYDGKAMAALGNVIIVNINYRLGPFGYLYFDHPDVPGNMGMLDQQLAFRWIQENIVTFGGNPSQITLFGESAGAASIVAHLIAPGSRELFKRGILQSGSLDNKWSLDSPKRAMEKSVALAKHHNCYKTSIEKTIACMKNIDADQLLDGIWNGLEFLEFPFHVIPRDRNFFTDCDAFEALRTGKFNKDVDLMIGINHDEGNYWNIYNLPEYFNKSEQPLLDHTDYLNCINTAFKKQPSLVKDAASFIYSDQDCKYGNRKNEFYSEQINQMVGDYYFTCDSLWLADHMNGKGKVFVYYFDQTSSANPWPKWAGVMHGYEIEFVFGVPVFNKTAGYTNKEKVFSEKIIKYWTNFAKYGNPYSEKESLVPWPDFHATQKWTYLKAEDIKPIERRKEKECQLWRSAKDIEYDKYLRENACKQCWYSSTVLLFGLTSSIRSIYL